MRIKLDENLSRHLKPALELLGHEVATCAEEDLLSKPDYEVASVAGDERRMLFTLDLKFADLAAFPPGTHPGVVLFRPRRMGPLAVNAFIIEFVRTTDLQQLVGCIVVAEWNRIRVRRPPLGPGA